MAVLTSSEKCLGLIIQRSLLSSSPSFIVLTKPSFTDRLQTLSWAGRNDAWKAVQSIGSGVCDAPAPNEIVNDITEISTSAVPEKSGPHKCRSAPTSTEMVTRI